MAYRNNLELEDQIRERVKEILKNNGAFGGSFAGDCEKCNKCNKCNKGGYIPFTHTNKNKRKSNYIRKNDLIKDYKRHDGYYKNKEGYGGLLSYQQRKKIGIKASKKNKWIQFYKKWVANGGEAGRYGMKDARDAYYKSKK